jgi:hypothetical protein
MLRHLLPLAAALALAAPARADRTPADYPGVKDLGAVPFDGDTAVVVLAQRKALLNKAVREGVMEEDCLSVEAVAVRALPAAYALPAAARDADARELWVLRQCGTQRGYVVTVGAAVHIWPAGRVAADGSVAPLPTADSITPAKIQAQYDRVKARLGTEYHVRHILVATQAQAQAALDRIRAGEPFATVAAQVSIDTGSARKGGDLAWANDHAYVGPFAQALRDLAPRGLSPQPVRTAFGWHVIEVLDARPVRMPAFDDVVDKIAEAMRAKVDNGL